MKRLFLLSAALVAATCSFAQKVELKSNRVSEPVAAVSAQKAHMLPRIQHIQMQAAKPEGKQVHRTLATGVYYNPLGGMYEGWNMEGSGWGYTIYNHAPFSSVTYQGSKPEGAWHINGQDLGVTGDSLVDEGLPYMMLYAPTFVVGVDSFNIGDNNIYGHMGKTNDSYASYAVYANGVLSCDSICPMYVADDHAIWWSGDQAYSNTASYGYLTSDNMFGSGWIEGAALDSTDLQVYGIHQGFRKLDTPLYAENMFLKGESLRENAMTANDTLMAVLYTVEGEDQVPFDTLYCLGTDVEPFVLDEYGRNEKQIYNGNLIFAKKTVDALGMESEEPVIVPAGKDWGVFVFGFDNDSISFGADGIVIPDEDVDCPKGTNMVQDIDGHVWYYGFSSRICVDMGFNGMFDQLSVLDNRNFTNVPEGTHMNALRLSDDGKTCTTEGQAADGDYNLGAVAVGTAITMFDGEGSENYTIVSDDDISWITWSVDTKDYFDNTSNFYGYNYILCEAEPLPAGTTGRMAICRVEGKGVESAPFVVLQGDAQMPTAIESVKATRANTGRVYNIAGQQVNANAKGLVIKNGQKMIVK